MVAHIQMILVIMLTLLICELLLRVIKIRGRSLVDIYQDWLSG